MNLHRQRETIRNHYENTGNCDSIILADYRKYRNTEEWRTSLVVEELCEYILYLESKLGENK
jgi:hypothetical protein